MFVEIKRKAAIEAEAGGMAFPRKHVDRRS